MHFDRRYRVFKPLALLLILAAMWESLRVFGLFDNDLVPSSAAIFGSVVENVAELEFWKDMLATMGRVAAGLLFSLLIGVPVGIAVGSLRIADNIGMSVIDFFRSIPVTTLYPVFVLTLGIGDRGKIGMILMGCGLVIAFHTATSIQRRSMIRENICKLYGASRSDLYKHVVLFESLPGVVTGTRIAIGFALIIATLTEMFMGARSGMGQTLMEAYSIYDLPTMYAYIFVLGLLGYVMNSVFSPLERRIQMWHRG